MNQTTAELKAEIKKMVQLLQELRDEVRVKIHLAAMDAKTQWNKLEPQVAAAERAAHEASAASREVLDKALKALKDFRASLVK
jgi:hypothetical protein